MKQNIKATIFMMALLFNFLHDNYAQPQKTWQWVSQLGGKSWDIAGGIACNSKNNLFVTGSFMDTLVCNGDKLASSGSQDIFVARYDQKGDLKDLWSGGGKGRDQATCITATGDNNIIIGGMITGEVRFDKLTNTGKGNRLFIANLNEKGKFSWISSISASGEASLLMIDTDSKGTVFAAGVFSDSLSSGSFTITSKGKKDIFMARFSASGLVEKLTALGGEENDLPTALSVSDSGNAVLAGITSKSFQNGNFEITAVNRNSNTTVNSNAFILCFNSNFEPLWKTRISGDEYCEVTSLKQDHHDNIYLAGSFNLHIRAEDTVLTSNGYSDGFLLKYNASGKLSWARNFGSWYYDYASHIIIDNFGGALVTGSMGDTLTIDSLTINPLSANNAALAIQFSPQGKATWADCISGSGRNFSDGAIIDPQGNLYLTGTFRDVFKKENTSLTSLGDQDVFLAKYYNCPTSKGEITGDTVLCASSTLQLSVNNDYSHVVWNDTTVDVHYIIAASPGMYKVRMLDKRGCVLTDTVEVTLALSSRFSLGEDASLPIENSRLLKAPEGYTGYRWQDGSDEATFKAEAENDLPGTYTYWLSAVDSLGCNAADTLNIEFYPAPQWIDLSEVQLHVYPNPVGDLLYWSVNTEKPCQFFVEIADDNGRIVYYSHIKNYQSGALMTVNFSDTPAGLYYIRLKNNTGQVFNTVSVIRK